MSLFLPLDVEYASDEEFVEAGPMAELLFIRAACFIKRKRLDGVIKKSQLPLFSAGIPQPKRAVRALIEVGLWQDRGETWVVPSYLKHNPSRKEIETKSEMAKETGEFGAHERWHVQEGRPSPKCRFCIADRIGTPIDPPNGVGCPPTEPPTPTEPEPPTETLLEQDSSSSNLDPTDQTTKKRDQVLNAIVDIRADGQPRSTAWRNTVRADVTQTHATKLDDWLKRFPDAPADVIAAALETGDARSLRYFTPEAPPPAEPERRLTPDERAAVLAKAKEETK